MENEIEKWCREYAETLVDQPVDGSPQYVCALAAAKEFYERGFKDGWNEATHEAIVEINKNYQPNHR
jgi:hypothetical protein